MLERLQKKRLPECRIVELPSVTYFVQIPTTEDGVIDSDAEWTLQVMPGGAHDAREVHKSLFDKGHMGDEQYGITQEVGGFLGTCLSIGALHLRNRGDACRMSVTREMTGHMSADAVLDRKYVDGVRYTLTTRWSALNETMPTYVAVLTKTFKNRYRKVEHIKQIICYTQGATATGFILADLAYRRLKYPTGGPSTRT